MICDHLSRFSPFYPCFFSFVCVLMERGHQDEQQSFFRIQKCPKLPEIRRVERDPQVTWPVAMVTEFLNKFQDHADQHLERWHIPTKIFFFKFHKFALLWSQFIVFKRPAVSAGSPGSLPLRPIRIFKWEEYYRNQSMHQGNEDGAWDVTLYWPDFHSKK